MIKDRVAVRLDEKTRQKLESFIKRKGMNVSEVIREAVNDYLRVQEISWAKIDYEVIPIIISSFKEFGFELIEVIKPDTDISRVIGKKIPIILCFEKADIRIDVKLYIEESNGKYILEIEFPNNQIVETGDITLSTGNITYMGLLTQFSEEKFKPYLEDTLKIKNSGLSKKQIETIKNLIDKKRVK